MTVIATKAEAKHANWLQYRRLKPYCVSHNGIEVNCKRFCDKVSYSVAKIALIELHAGMSVEFIF